MKILVLCESYSSLGDVYRMAWAHTRNKQYFDSGHQVDVLNFNAVKSYIYDSIQVLVEKDAVKNIDKYDIIVSHAPNLRHHLPFLFRFRNKKTAFFFHGHEVLYEVKDYPEPYPYMTKSFGYRVLKNIYDYIKIKSLKFLIHGYKKNSSHLVFVSEWMKRQYEKNLGVSLTKNQYSVIHNPVWNDFINRDFKVAVGPDRRKKIVTLRKLDDSKYSVDLVVRLARSNPSVDFFIYGRGRYFEYHDKPSNVIVKQELIAQAELTDFFNQFDVALLPTRYDAQGVLACEVASFGMPLVTSDIEVAREMLEGFDNVGFIDNEDPESFSLNHFFESIKPSGKKLVKFSPEVTVGEELRVFGEFVTK